MPRVKVKVLRGNGLEQVVTVDTEATKGATLGTDVRLPSGAVATPTTFLQWLGTTPGSSSGSGSSGPSLSSILTTKGDLATRDTQVQRLGIGTQDQALRVSAAGMPEWRSGAALTKADDTNVTLTLGGSPTTSLLAAASLTLGWTGQLGETRGGTAQSGYLTGDMLYATALNTLGKLGIGASGRWLGSSGSVPQWNAPAALTRTDDTNVTLTLGGSPTTALLNAASLTLGWTGQLAVSRGGTGKNALGTLSKTDDTNVTLTLGGTPANSLIESVSLTLGWTGQLGATRGGTAQSGYLTGDILYASALNTLSKLGIGSSGNVLTVAGGVPTWAAPTGGASGANPTASVGLTAVNGAATTFMRSDGAPALDQGIAPTWTGRHTFSDSFGGPAIRNTDCLLEWYETDVTTDQKAWWARVTSSVWALQTRTDAYGLGSNALLVARSGTAITVMEYGNSTDNPTHTFYGPLILTHSAGGPNGAIRLQAAIPNIVWTETDQTTDEKSWLAIANGKIWRLRTVNDANTDNRDIIAATRGTGIAIASIDYGNSTDNPTHTFFGVHNGSGGNLRSGTYTPTLTNVANASGSTANAAQWMRVGNVVTVSGSINATPTAGSWQLGISLPIASNITDQTQLAGAMSNGNVVARIQGDAGNDRATTFAAAGASDTYTYTFTYLIN